jgi:hypothetical protein
VLRLLVKSENDPVASTASTVVGQWIAITHWGNKPYPFPPSALVFNQNGSFNWGHDSGWWIQNEGLLFLFFPDQNFPPGLIYTANVTSDALAGVMGYACDVNKYNNPGVPPPGVWWATRPGLAQVTLAEPRAAPARLDFDPVKGLPKNPASSQ